MGSRGDGAMGQQVTLHELLHDLGALVRECVALRLHQPAHVVKRRDVSFAVVFSPIGRDTRREGNRVTFVVRSPGPTADRLVLLADHVVPPATLFGARTVPWSEGSRRSRPFLGAGDRQVGNKGAAKQEAYPPRANPRRNP